MTEEIMNIESVIFDPSDNAEEDKTINGVPAGYMSPNYPRMIDEKGEQSSIDLSVIVSRFHKNPEQVCVYTGLPVDGINVIDGNSNNFLITNLEPVSKQASNVIPFMPKISANRRILTDFGDFDIELFGVPSFRAYRILDSLHEENLIENVPSTLNLPYEELKLMWIWNDLTKVKLLKGLKKIKWINRKTNSSIELTNESVAEFCIRALHADVTEGFAAK